MSSKSVEMQKHIGIKKKREGEEEETAKSVKREKEKLGKKNKAESVEYHVVEVTPTFSKVNPERIRIELTKEMPKITAKEYKAIEITPEFAEHYEWEEIKLSREIPDFGRYVVEYTLPNIRPRFEEFEVDTLKIDVNKKLPVFDKTVMFPLIFPQVNFDYSLSPENVEILVDEELPEKISDVTILTRLKFGNKIIPEVSEMLKESEGKRLETIEDFMDEELKKKWDGMGMVSGERPTIIWVDKDSGLLPFIKIIARELYRIKMGGFPRSHHYKVIAPPSYSAVDDLTADRSIFVITADILKNIFDKNKDEEDKEKRRLFLSKLEAIYAQRGGFIIAEFEKDKTLLLRIENASYKEIYVGSSAINVTESKFAKIMGLVEYEEEVSESFVGAYGSIDRKYQDELEKLATYPKYSPLVKPSAGEESILHYALKVFTYKYLREKRKIEEENIQTEYPLNDGEYIPDIAVGRTSKVHEVYEIEALYGKGFTIGRTLYEKVEKAAHDNIKQVHFVLSPIHYFILGKGIRTYLKEIKKKFEYVDIYIDIPVFAKEKFRMIPIST